MCPLLQCKSTFLYVGCLVMVVYFFCICSVVENEIMFAIRSKCYNQLKLKIYIYIQYNSVEKFGGGIHEVDICRPL